MRHLSFNISVPYNNIVKTCVRLRPLTLSCITDIQNKLASQIVTSNRRFARNSHVARSFSGRFQVAVDTWSLRIFLS